MATPTLKETLDAFVASHTSRLRVAMPGKVESFDAASRTCSVLPDVRAVYQDGTDESLPVISDVPVHYPGGGGFRMVYPLERGDPVLLVFTDRSLDEWKGATVAQVTPASKRKHALTDAIAIPGVYAPGAVTDAVTGESGRLAIGTFNGTELRLGASGTVALGSSTAEVVALLRRVVSQLLIATTPGPGFAFDPATLAELGAVEALLATIEE